VAQIGFVFDLQENARDQSLEMRRLVAQRTQAVGERGRGGGREGERERARETESERARERESVGIWALPNEARL